MIKRRFFKVDHGDRDGSGHSSSSSDEDYDNQTTDQESDDDDEVISPSSGSFVHSLCFFYWKMIFSVFWHSLEFGLVSRYWKLLK